MGIGDKIKERRENLGLSQDDLASKLGYKSRTTIAKMESGANDITQSMVLKLASILETSPGYLMSWGSDDNAMRQIPVLGTIAAGEPLYAEQHIENHIAIPESWGIDFALRVKGQSMINAHINDGSIVFCRRQQTVDDGQIAVCLIDGQEATLKRLKWYDGLLVLHAENPTYEDLVFRGKEKASVQILGLCKHVLNKLD